MPGWLNQVEIYFSIIQRKVLTPNDFASPGGSRTAVEVVRGVDEPRAPTVRLEIRPGRSANVPDQAGGQACARIFGNGGLMTRTLPTGVEPNPSVNCEKDH